jgi:hypothetical protein
MLNSRPFDTARNTIKVALIVSFITLLWLPSLDGLFHWDETPQVNEKRALASFPSFQPGLSGLRSFLSGLEAFYNDHFGFRRRLVYCGQRWRKAWFQESPLPTVMIGLDGWLFYSDDQTVEDIRATALFKPGQLQAWKLLLQRRRDWLAQRGIRYLFVVAPDKHSIYPEKLPTWIKQVGPLTKLDQFMAYMKANSTVPTVDLRPALVRAKGNGPTYLLTDTHWNQYGAFIGYRELMQTLSKQLPGLEPLSLDAFARSTRAEPGGNLASMLAQGHTTLENRCPNLSPRPPLSPLRVTRDKADPARLITENGDRTGKAVVFRDSFSEAWVPLVGYHFNKVIYSWQYHWSRALIENEQPDVVIDELLEHYFYQQDPARLKLLDGLDEPPPTGMRAAVAIQID